jgi:molybdopterin-binding protein
MASVGHPRLGRDDHAAITAEAVADLGLEPGKPVTVSSRATEVMLAMD